MLLLALICTLKIDTQGPSRCSVSNPCQACIYKCVFTHQPSHQHATKHAHHCHAHDEPRQCLSIGWGSWWLAKSTQDHCSCMKCVSFWAFNILPHICFTSQPRSPGNSLLTYFTGSQISSLLLLPPIFSVHPDSLNPSLLPLFLTSLAALKAWEVYSLPSPSLIT